MCTVICFPKPEKANDLMEQKFYLKSQNEIEQIAKKLGSSYYIGYNRGTGWIWINR
jgi:hypothetical protein